MVFCVILSLTATASTNFIKETQSKLNTLSKKENKTSAIHQAYFTKFDENVNEKKVTNSNFFALCFVYISQPYFEEAMDGTLHMFVDITVRCYGPPGNDIIIVTQQ